MNVLMLNGSPHKAGCTFTALQEVGRALEANDIDYEIWQIDTKAVQDCVACRACSKTGRCTFKDDDVNAFVERAAKADGFVFGSPVYYAHPTGAVLSFLDRAFYSGKAAFQNKPGAAIVSARRAGTTASVDVLNKYFTIANMPIASASYWNMVHGSQPADVLQDLEGLQTMRNIGGQLAWMIKAFDAARNAGVAPYTPEVGAWTNFIR